MLTLLMGLSPLSLFATITLYFFLLLFMAWWANRRSHNDNHNFFSADQKSAWYLIAFGTIGGSLSGVTFVSVPGQVGAGAENQQFAYWQIVLGYVVGYWIIAAVLLPIYYRLRLVSIYSYLEGRFGVMTYKTGASFFVLSRSIGTAFRLFLTTMVLHNFIFAAFGLPFFATVLGILTLIFIYTYKGGIQTIVWTDAIQTIFMLASVFFALYALSSALGIGGVGEMWQRIEEAKLGQIFFFDNAWADPNNFYKQFLAGVSVAIVMTGLDQDMMQKNLTCHSLWDAQKNLIAFSIAVLVMNFVFLLLGALLSIYAAENGIDVKPDKLFPTVALEHFSPLGALMFIIGLTAAAYASTDSALTALTTSFCVDLLGMGKKDSSAAENGNTQAANRAVLLRRLVHVGFVLFVFAQILIFYWIDDQSIINSLLRLAGYTYGPLLGLYTFGIFTRRRVRDYAVPALAILSPVLTFLLNYYSVELFWGYKFSFELLIINGLLMFTGLCLLSVGMKNEQLPA